MDDILDEFGGIFERLMLEHGYEVVRIPLEDGYRWTVTRGNDHMSCAMHSGVLTPPGVGMVAAHFAIGVHEEFQRRFPS